MVELFNAIFRSAWTYWGTWWLLATVLVGVHAWIDSLVKSRRPR